MSHLRFTFGSPSYLFTQLGNQGDRCALVLVMPARLRDAISGILAGGIPGFGTAFFCSNAIIALARSLCKCLLAVLITASEAKAVIASTRGVESYDVIPHGEIPGFGTATFFFLLGTSRSSFICLALYCCFKDDLLRTGHISCLVITSHRCFWICHSNS